MNGFFNTQSASLHERRCISRLNASHTHTRVVIAFAVKVKSFHCRLNYRNGPALLSRCVRVFITH